MTNELIEILEHQKLNDKQKDCLSSIDISLPNNNDSPEYLGLSSFDKVGYFIGAKWIKENEVAIVVNPKIKNLDYLKMFMHCFHNPITSQNISKIIYDIDFEKTPIQLPSSSFELTPLIIIHFLNLVKKIVKKGLKRDYIWVENNLNSKIKGKVLINNNIKHNIIKSRPDRTFCKYQEYSQNCIENKLLKKALDFVFTYLKIHYRNSKELLNLYYYNSAAFSNISSDIDINKTKNIKTNPLYKEYNEALKIAKLILRRFDYSIRNTEKNEENYPPFYINMSLLFERYVYSKLFKVFGNAIQFQVNGEYGDVDFLNLQDKTIIDTKYKTYYNENFTGQQQWKRDNIAKDIRQLSGYSRDMKLLSKLNIDTTELDYIVDCVIIYPNQLAENENIEVENFKQENSKIVQFNKFYKYSIRLPEKTTKRQHALKIMRA